MRCELKQENAADDFFLLTQSLSQKVIKLRSKCCKSLKGGYEGVLLTEKRNALEKVM